MSTPTAITRRDFIKTAALGVGSLPLLPVELTCRQARAKSVILLWMDGGPSHLDTFDPKPSAPAGIRCEFGVIPTSVPGLRICDRLPRLARLMNRCMLVRSLSHSEESHERACHTMLTGCRPAGGSRIPPSIGSIVARES